MKGWHKESYRHYLAAKRIKTAKDKVKLKDKLRFIYEDPEKGRRYPVSMDEVHAALHVVDHKGLKEVEFQNPRDEQQENAYAQYKRGRRALTVFSQPAISKTEFVEGKQVIPAKRLKRQILEKIIPHEVAHHKILYRARITDDSVEMAEARAEALRNGFNYKDDKVVRSFVNYAQAPLL